MAIGAEAKEIKGKVMADGKGLAKVVVTDGTAFALTSEDGSYMIDADEKAHFIYVVTPSGYMAPCNGVLPSSIRLWTRTATISSSIAGEQ